MLKKRYHGGDTKARLTPTQVGAWDPSQRWVVKGSGIRAEKGAFQQIYWTVFPTAELLNHAGGHRDTPTGWVEKGCPSKILLDSFPLNTQFTVIVSFFFFSHS